MNIYNDIRTQIKDALTAAGVPAADAEKNANALAANVIAQSMENKDEAKKFIDAGKNVGTGYGFNVTETPPAAPGR
jgi:hypothetical protein